MGSTARACACAHLPLGHDEPGDLQALQPPERHLARQQLPEHHTEGEHVAGRRDRLLLDDLGGRGKDGGERERE